MRRFSPLLMAWLVTVWLMLWGSLEPIVVVSGVLVAAVLLVLFPLQPVRTRVLARPFRVLFLAVYLAWNLLISGLRVARDAACYGSRAKAVIVEVPILADTDFVVASAANMLSLGPGRFVLHIDRPAGYFYVYVLGVGPAGASWVYEEAITMQVWVAKAFGSRDEVRAVVSRAARAGECEHTAMSIKGDE